MARSDRVSLTYTADIGDIRRKLKQIPDLTAAEVRQATSALNKATRQTQRAAQRGRRDAKGFSTSLAAVGAAATGAVVGLGMMAQSVADARNNLTDLSTRSGVARETIAGLKVAADGSGVSFSKIESILGRLPKTMSDVQAGSKKQSEAFRALGVNVTNADGTLRDADSVFRDSIKAIGGLSSETDKAAAATQLFGRQGSYLLQALGDPAALETFVSLAGQSAIATRAAADAAAQYQRDMAILNMELDSAKAVLSDALGLDNFPIVVAGALRAATVAFEHFFGYFESKFGLVADVFEGLVDLDFRKVGQSLVGLAEGSTFGPKGLIATTVNAISEANEEIKELGRNVGELRARGAGAAPGGERFIVPSSQRDGPAADPTAEIKEREKAVEQLQAITEKASMAILEGEEKLTAEYQKQLNRIAELELVSGNRAVAEQARAATKDEYDAELSELRRQRRREEAEEQAELTRRQEQAEEEAHQKEMARLQERRRVQEGLYNAIDNLASTSAAALLQRSQTLSETNREAALQTFKLYKAVSLAQAIMSGAAAATRAFADYPYPASLAIASLVAAQTGIQVAMIASQKPTFADTPGLQRVGYSGMTASFAPGDLVVAGRDEGDLVRQMQRAGIGSGGTQVLIRDTDSHRGRYGRDPLRAPDRYGLIKRRAGRIPGRR